MKLGITMEGGASRTVFSCGVADALLEENILPDYFMGVSAGIAFGLSYISGQKGRNLELAKKYMGDKRYMGMKYLFKDKNYYNLPFAFGEVPDKLLPYDYAAFQAFPGRVVACVTNIHTGQAEYIDVPRENVINDVVIASCAIPVLFKPVKVGGRYYLDGGLADSIPYEQCVREGCDKNIVILTRPRDYIKKSEKAGNVAGRMYKKYPRLVETMKARPEQYNACREKLWEQAEAGEVFVIAPEDLHGVGRTEGDGEKLTLLFYEGYHQMRSRMDELKEYLNRERDNGI